MSRYEQFDRSRIELEDLAERGHDLTIDDCWPLDAPFEPYVHPEYDAFIEQLVEARRRDRAVIVMMGGHPIKLGLSRFFVDLVEQGVITHLATNGSGVIHDFELALVGGTSEDVQKWIRRGQFA